jgi:hypothetical protein
MKVNYVPADFAPLVSEVASPIGGVHYDGSFYEIDLRSTLGESRSERLCAEIIVPSVLEGVWQTIPAHRASARYNLLATGTLAEVPAGNEQYGITNLGLTRILSRVLNAHQNDTPVNRALQRRAALFSGNRNLFQRTGNNVAREALLGLSDEVGNLDQEGVLHMLGEFGIPYDGPVTQLGLESRAREPVVDIYISSDDKTRPERVGAVSWKLLDTYQAWGRIFDWQRGEQAA